MTTASEVETVLIESGTPESRILNFAALLTREAGDEIIVVGGSAIEIYTRGAYASGDIDLVGDRKAVSEILRTWKFVQSGWLWIRKDWKIAIDLVGPSYTGSRFRTSLIQTKYGPVRVAAIEDLLVKRLAEAKHWRVKAALEEAALLWKDFQGRLDMDYLRDAAEDYDVIDILRDLSEAVGATPPRQTRRIRGTR